jgi:hypothetical protein
MACAIGKTVTGPQMADLPANKCDIKWPHDAADFRDMAGLDQRDVNRGI